MIPFVTNSKCPKATTWTPSYIKRVDEWYANLQAKTHHNKMEDYKKGKDPSPLTLWMAWQGIHAHWGQLVEKYQVSALPPLLACPCIALLAPTHHVLPLVGQQLCVDQGLGKGVPQGGAHGPHCGPPPTTHEDWEPCVHAQLLLP